MRATHINIEKVENGWIIENDGKTWIAESSYQAGEIIKPIINALDGKDDLDDLEAAVAALADEREAVTDGR